eukprot:2210712-Heterocapsa_arctica.AAC.1
MAWIHKEIGGATDFTLHSPRFFLPTVGAQLDMGMHHRRALGHWGHKSMMPVRYDQSRCCAELLAKQKLWDALKGGFKAAADFRVPATPGQAPQTPRPAPPARRTPFTPTRAELAQERARRCDKDE